MQNAAGRSEIATTFKTPGVYINEVNAFANSVVPVPTAVTAFIGSTAIAADAEGSSLIDRPTPISSLAEFRAVFGSGHGALDTAVPLFYANGGAEAWIVSVGVTADAPSLERLRAGLAALEREAGPTIVVVPESVGLTRNDHYAFARETLAHCAAMRSRMAILDVHGGDSPANADPAAGARLIADFRAAMAEVPQEQRRFGACYFPFLRQGASLVAPSAAMVGLWAMTDAAEGVWRAPANASPAGVDGPAFLIDQAMQEGMNVSVADGLSVNAIRSFPGRGTLVWGARTLDGNSQDYRYIPVVRTLMMIEQSIALAIRAYVFEANDANTWTGVRAMTENFLTGLWRAGALAGRTSQDAFAVQCGLGTTLTEEDLLAGVLRVSVMVAILRPAEFIVITLEQQMQPA